MNEPSIKLFGGEVSPEIDARIDIEKYVSACRHCENFIAVKTGYIERRPGTKFIYKSEKPDGLLEEHDV